MSQQNNTPQAVQACHELLLWMIPQLDKFPRSRRYTLGLRLENGLLMVLENLIEATYSQQKQAVLRSANRQLEVNRHLTHARASQSNTRWRELVQTVPKVFSITHCCLLSVFVETV